MIEPRAYARLQRSICIIRSKSSLAGLLAGFDRVTRPSCQHATRDGLDTLRERQRLPVADRFARSVARELRRLRSQAGRPYLLPRRAFDIQSPVGRAYHQWLA